MKIALLVSGDIGFQVFKKLLVSNNEICCVLTNKDSVEIIKFGEASSIPVFVGNPRNSKGVKFARQFHFEVLLSVNYLFLIEKNLISLAKLSFNIHGSLLPKYRGRTPHVWAIINNEKSAGITAHLIDEGCDTGDILRQVEIPIEENDTGADILEKYNQEYFPIIDLVLKDFEKGPICAKKQDGGKATFFGKRTPEDGEIDWDWQKERIRNWVRALAYPYPGAFSYVGKSKIIIDEISYSDFGFEQSQPNGLIVSGIPFLVKTSNGIVEITRFRSDNKSFKKGQILGK